MIQVLLFHAWQVGSPIGVDAFITISAFLMTSSFVRRVDHGQIPFLVERWAHTFKRLLPPLVIVVLLTVGASALILPRTRWQEVIVQGIASVTYWQNWRLVETSADYFASDHSGASPLQHLWSMSMQGQIFLLWPLIMTVCALVARRAGVRMRTVSFFAFTVITVVSLGWLLLSAPEDGSVYFDTRARVWEFSFASALAAAAPMLRLSARRAKVVSWCGLLVLLLYSLVSIGSYPGPMAAIPMLAVSVILLFPSGEESHGVGGILGWRPLVWLGDISYAVYLVHWPVFVFYLAMVGRRSLGLVEGGVLMAASIATAWALTRWIDDPLRNLPWSNRRTANKLIVVAVSLVVGLVPLLLAQNRIVAARDSALANESKNSDTEHPGASVFLGNGAIESFTSDPVPGPFGLDLEWRRFPGECTQRANELFDHEELQSSCESYGDRTVSNGHVLVAGDSHAKQNIVPQVEPLLRFWGLSAESILQGACSWGIPDSYDGACAQRNRDLLTYVDETSPDYVMLIVTASRPDSPLEELRPGVEELIRTLTARGIEVVGVRDNLRSDDNLYECSSEREADSSFGGCLLDRHQHFADVDPGEALVGIEGFHYVDMTDAYCTEDVCPTIVGNVFVYMDHNHVSGSYSDTVAPYFSERVSQALGFG